MKRVRANNKRASLTANIRLGQKFLAYQQVQVKENACLTFTNTLAYYQILRLVQVTKALA